MAGVTVASLALSPWVYATAAPAAAPAYPDSGTPVAPVMGRLTPQAETGSANRVEHVVRLPPGVWEVRLRSGAFAPVMEVSRDGVPVVASTYEARRGEGVVATLDAAATGAYRVTVCGARADDAGDYLLTVNPASPTPVATPVATLDLELRPTLAYPVADGAHAAAPVCLMLDAGKHYRLAARCENSRTWLLLPPQHGLTRRLSTLALAGKGEDARIDFIAPRTGLYVFWCLAEDRDFRTRATVVAESFSPGAALPRPSANDFLHRASLRQLVLWKRHAFAPKPTDPELFIPCPPRSKLRLELIAGEGAAAYEFIVGGRVVKLTAPRGATAAESVVLPEGATGLRVRAASAGNLAPALLSVCTDSLVAAEDLGQISSALDCALPAVLRAKVKAGAHVAVGVRGAGVSPQVVIRGAGILAGCSDPNGTSPVAVTGGVATRDGVVEVLIAAGGAEEGAFAACAFNGFAPRSEGRGVDLELPDVAVLSAPGVAVMGSAGALSDGSAKLADGSRVNWVRVPVKAGRLYRVLVDAAFPPDLVLDVPGEGKRLAPCGVAILHPTADGDATLGIAAPGANLAGDYAMSVADIGAAEPQAKQTVSTPALHHKPSAPASK